MSKFLYAGIGSQETPEHILIEMEQMAITFAKSGCVLRSGGTRGADTAFEKGCDSVNRELKEIFRPWPWKGHTPNTFNTPTQDASKMASTLHPVWDKLSIEAQLLMARNCHIILGYDLKTPVDTVVCWTPRGMEVGGTAMGIWLAKRHQIPIMNLGTPRTLFPVT